MSMEIAPTGVPRTYRLAGELDLLSADQVAAKLEPESREHGDLILDLSDLAFIDSSGIRVLLQTAEDMEDRGRLILRAPNRQVQVVLSLVGVAREGSGIVVEDAQEPDWGTPVKRTFPTERASLAQIRAFVRRRAMEDSFAEWADGIVLAVSEACANSVLHSGSPELEVTWRPYADHAEVEVRDEGVFKRDVAGDSGGTGNRGFLLMMALMDRISITCGTDNRPGTVVRMVKDRKGIGTSGSRLGASASADGRFSSPQRRVAFLMR